MSSNLCILCPGQGAQVIGMGKDFFDAHVVAKGCFQTADDILGFKLSSLCFEGPQERLNQTDISQPAIYVTSIAAYSAAATTNSDLMRAPPAICAGLSLGEYTALFLGGAISFEDGLKLVAARGRHMQEAATATPSGMVAIMGADEAAVNQLCQEAAQGQVLVPANFNAPGQIVISGASEACARAAQLAETKGFKAVPLAVAGAFHSPLMKSAAEKMAIELEKVEFKAPRGTVYSNVTGAPHCDPASIKKLLVDQITQPVRWEQTMQKLVATPDLRFVELAPGRTLTGMLKKINRRLPVESWATTEFLAPKSN